MRQYGGEALLSGFMLLLQVISHSRRIERVTTRAGCYKVRLPLMFCLLCTFLLALLLSTMSQALTRYGCLILDFAASVAMSLVSNILLYQQRSDLDKKIGTRS
jgi:hypothetical protein